MSRGIPVTLPEGCYWIPVVWVRGIGLVPGFRVRTDRQETWDIRTDVFAETG